MHTSDFTALTFIFVLLFEFQSSALYQLLCKSKFLLLKRGFNRFIEPRFIVGTDFDTPTGDGPVPAKGHVWITSKESRLSPQDCVKTCKQGTDSSNQTFMTVVFVFSPLKAVLCLSVRQ